MDGKDYTFGEKELAQIAGSYNPATHEAPIVVGHPAHDAPAFGWIAGLRAEGDRLVADPQQIDPQFAELVKAGRYKKISAAFYAPDSKGNPTPGAWALRHVGFLGAQPPAVKGLKQAAFASDDSYLAFGDMDRAGRIFRDIGAMMQRVREWIIETSSVEQADKVLPSWQIDSINDQSARLDEPMPAWSEPTNPETDVNNEDIAKRQKELDDRAAQIDAQEKAIEARARAARQATDAAFVERMIGEGRVLPAEKDGLVAFMGTLADQDDAVAFGEGDKEVKQSASAFLQKFLAGLPVRVDFSERGNGGVEPLATDAVAFSEQIKAEQAEVRTKTGREISGAEAAQRIRARTPH